jgi:hypothetical protein
MASERQLRLGGKYPDPDVSAFARRKQKDRLGKVHLPREALHVLRREGPTVDENSELIALQGLGSENVTDEIRMELCGSVPVAESRDHC